MKLKTIKHNKLKNTGVLFELLVRQVTAETIENKPSAAINIIHSFFNTNTELGKELQLYKALSDSQKTLTEAKAIDLLNVVGNHRKKLNERKLGQEKYSLIREIKRHYPLSEFLSNKIDNYTLHASIYKTFLTESTEDSIDVINVREIADARHTLVEHLSGAHRKRLKPEDSSTMLEEFRKESEEIRLLAYKIAIEKFNENYSDLDDRQKSLLREYINNISSTQSLYEYVMNEIPVLQNDLRECSNRAMDRVVGIKLNEVVNQLDSIGVKKTIRDNEVTALMIAYQILKECTQ